MKNTQKYKLERKTVLTYVLPNRSWPDKENTESGEMAHWTG